MTASTKTTKPMKPKTQHEAGSASTRRSPMTTSFLVSTSPFVDDQTVHQSPKPITLGDPIPSAQATSLPWTRECIMSEFAGFLSFDRRCAGGLGPDAVRVVLAAMRQLSNVAGGNTQYPFHASPRLVVVRCTKELAPNFDLYMTDAKVEALEADIAAGELPAAEVRIGKTRSAVSDALAWAGEQSAQGLNVFIAYITREMLSSNNRGMGDGSNHSPLQKITQPDGSQNVVISAYALRNALREAAPVVAEQLGLEWKANRSRVHNASELTVAFEAAPNADTYHDDFLFGFMATKKSKTTKVAEKTEGEPEDGDA